MMHKFDSSRLRAAEEFFHEKIPLTRAMGLRVIADDDRGFALEAPVALNYNHLHTAFGGSINAVATLAGYCFLWMELETDEIHVVVRESSIRFLHPVRESIRAVCMQPDAGKLSDFRQALQARGKARMALQVRVDEGRVLAAQFEGVFVALSNRTAK